MASRSAEIRALATGANLEITDSQVRAVAAQAGVYESDASPAAGLHHLALTEHCGGTVAARFYYLHRGLPANLGLEITVFAAAGEPIDSQDFG